MKVLKFWMVLPLILCISASVVSQESNTEKFPTGKPYATMFYDYYYVVQGDDLYGGKSWYSNNNRNDNAFSFRRVYFGYDHVFNKTFTGRVQLELTDLTTLSNGNRAFFLKDASLRWKNIYPLADLFIGHTATPIWSVGGSESYWRYRSIERTIVDHRGMRSSSDAGMRLQGRFTEDGRFGYNIMIGNGVGARAENDKYKVTYMNLWTKLFEKRLYLEIFQDFNKASNNRSVATTKAFVAWKTDLYTIGTELVYQKKEGYGFTGQDIEITGISTFAHADIIKDKFRFFCRYDSYNPDYRFEIFHYDPTKNLPFDEEFITLGFDFIPSKNISIMPNLYIHNYKNKTASQITPKTELVARLTFNVTFR